jgi:hypothetical protein
VVWVDVEQFEGAFLELVLLGELKRSGASRCSVSTRTA